MTIAWRSALARRAVDFARNLMSVTESLVPVSAYADQKIAEHLRARMEQRGAPLEAREPLFVNGAGKPLNRDKFRETVIKPALAAAGLPTNLRTYDLRHAHTSMLIDLGANVLAVAQRMAHSDPSMTLREYGHLFQGVQEQLSAKLDELREATGRTREAKVLPLAASGSVALDASRDASAGGGGLPGDEDSR